MIQTEETAAQPEETPARRLMRQWYQALLGLKVLQAGQMAEDRRMLRRGARKQQDGTLGTTDQPPENEVDEMQIRVGDEVHHHVHNNVAAPPPPEPPPPTEPDTPPPEAPAPAEPDPTPEREGMSTLGKVAVALGAAALIPGIGIPLAAAFGAFDKPPAHAEFTDTDTDTFPSVIVERPTSPDE